MMSAVRDDSYLVQQLLEFHAELARIRQALSAPAQPLLSGPDAAPALQSHLELGGQVRAFLDQQGAEAEAMGGRHGREQAEAARYLKVALADEALIGVPDWPLRKQWIDCPLEYQVYGTRSAGERIFDRIGLLLRQEAGSQRELALVYLLGLGMGFQGRYRNQPGGPAELQRWRRELYVHAYRRPPDSVFASASDGAEADLGPRLMPQPYRYTQDTSLRLLPNPRRWALYFVLTVLGLLLLSQLTWQSEIGPLQAELARAEKREGPSK